MDYLAYADLMDDTSDAELVEAMERHDNQTGGNPLFQFRLAPTGPRWRNVVERRVFDAKFDQTRDATPRDNLGGEFTGALRRAVIAQIEEDPTIEPHHHLHFVLQASTGTFNHLDQPEL